MDDPQYNFCLYILLAFQQKQKIILSAMSEIQDENSQTIGKSGTRLSLTEKIKILKQDSTNKKKRSHQKSESVKLLPFPSPNQNFSTQKKKILLSQHKTISLPPEIETDNLSATQLKTIHIGFNNKGSVKVQKTPFTVQQWLPSRSINLKVKNQYKQFQHNQQQHRRYSKGLVISKPWEDEKKSTKEKGSLLRKNSLFLLNYLATRERKSLTLSQPCHTPLIIDKISTKVSNVDVKMERRRNFLDNLKQIRGKVVAQSQIEEIFQPQPW